MIGNTGRKLLVELLTALVSGRGRRSISNTCKERVLVKVLLFLEMMAENAFAPECIMMVVVAITTTAGPTAAVAADDLSRALITTGCDTKPLIYLCCTIGVCYIEGMWNVGIKAID